MMGVAWALIRANPGRWAVGGLVVALIVALGIARCQQEAAQVEVRQVTEQKARVDERARLQTEIIQNVQKAQEAVARPDAARTERLRSRWDRTRQDSE